MHWAQGFYDQITVWIEECDVGDIFYKSHLIKRKSRGGERGLVIRGGRGGSAMIERIDGAYGWI